MSLEKSKRSNLDVWAIQYESEELLTALANIKNKSANTILFTNVMSEFQIGETRIVTRQFDTFLYSKENDLLVMIMRAGIATPKDIADYLDNNGIDYQIVTAMPNISEYEDGNKIPEIWIAREDYVVADALDNSVNKEIRECDYYPNLVGKIDLNMLSNTDKTPLTIDGRDFKGLLQLQDKIILLVDHEEERTCKPESIVSMLDERQITFNTIMSGEPQIIQEERGLRR